MANIINFTGNTTLDIPVETVCDGAKTWAEVLIIGTDKDGNTVYACSFGDGYKMLWTAEKFAADLLAGKF